MAIQTFQTFSLLFRLLVNYKQANSGFSPIRILESVKNEKGEGI